MATTSGNPSASPETKLPVVVIDSLRRYTAQKATLLEWFTSTAKTLGDLAVTPKPSVEDLVRLARRTTQATNPAIPVPSRILRSLTETIDLRKRCNAWYEEQGNTNPGLRESNQTHRYFLTKLEEVLGVLTQARVDEPRTAEVQDQEKDKATQNTFGALDIESLDITEESDRVDPGKHNIPTKQQRDATLPSTTPPPTFTDIWEDSDGGLRFAVSCLQVDLQAIREFLSERLALFRDGSTSLIRLSLVVNAAIWSARRLERDLQEAFPILTSWDQVLDATLPDVAHIEGPPFEVLVPSQMEALESSLFLPFHQLRRFCDYKYKHNQAPSYPLDAVPLENRGDQEPQIQNRWKYSSTILNELFCEVAMLGHDEHLPIRDELVRGLKKSFATRTIHLWVVFGLQLFLDTQHLLGKGVTRGFRELESAGTTCLRINERRITVAQVILKERFSEDQKGRLRDHFSPVDKWIRNDEFMSVRRRLEATQQGRPFFFLKHNPVTCGLFQSALLLKLHSAGMRNANSTQYIASVAHLYCAASNEDLLSGTWPDMDNLIDLYGSESIFLGEPPKNSWQYLPSFAIMLGISAQNFAKGRSNKKVKESVKGRRLLKPPALMDKFEKMLWQSDPSKAVVNPGHVEAFLHTLFRDIKAQSQEGRVVWGQWAKLESLNTVQMLAFLEELIASEEPDLKFNYQALNEQCLLLLATIEMNTSDKFATWVTNSMGPDCNMNTYMTLLPYFIFTRDHDNNLLSMVGGTIDDFIRRKCQVPNKSVNVALNGEGWEGLEEDHPTHNGDCLHWGRCGRDMAETEHSDSNSATAT